MAKVVYDETGSYHRDSRRSSQRSFGETNSYDSRYRTSSRSYETEGVNLPPSLEMESRKNEFSRVTMDSDRYKIAHSYNDRYEAANKAYETEKMLFNQSGRRSPPSLDTNSIQKEPSRIPVSMERSYNIPDSYDDRYEAANRAYETEKMHFNQARERGPPSLDINSVQNEPLRLPMSLERSYTKPDSYDDRYEAANRAYETEEVHFNQSRRRSPPSLETDTLQNEPSRLPMNLERSYKYRADSYDDRYDAANRAYETEEVHLIQPGRRGPPSLESGSIKNDPSRPQMNNNKAGSYDARYKVNKSYNLEEVHLIQPGRRGPKSLETDSVHTDLSRIPMGLDIFLNTDQFVIRQNHKSEAWWKTAHFQVEDGRGKQFLEIRQEKADNSCIQAIFGSMREYFMKVYVNSGDWIMEFEHPWSCLTPVFCPWASPSMIVRMPTGEILGRVKNASRETCGSCLPPTRYFEVLNHEENIISAVTGPTCYPCECSRTNPASFELLKVEKSGKSHQIGDITHQWRGCCGGVASCCFTQDNETVTVSFPKDSQVEDKALFLSLGFLVFFTFFEVK